MSVTGGFVVFVVILVVFGTDGSYGAPRPCPQFLPVAVRLDQQIPINSYSLKALVKVKDDLENAISKHPESNFVVSANDLLTFNNIKETTTKKSDELKLLRISELSTTIPSEIRSQKPKKRRRAKPKESKTIMPNQNSSWALKTINDKPAEEVLVTDKASLARDLKDSTESALVSVRKLGEH